MGFTQEQADTAREFHVTGPHGRPCDSKNGPIRWRRNGKTRRYKRDKERFELPVKHGMFAYDRLTAFDLANPNIHAVEDCPVQK